MFELVGFKEDKEMWWKCKDFKLIGKFSVFLENDDLMNGLY